MKVQYVRDRGDVLHGVVTRLDGMRGIVAFDGVGSAYFNLADGCTVGLGEAGGLYRAIKFTGSIQIRRPEPHGDNDRRRIVAILGRSAHWAHVWAYEADYNRAAAEHRRLIDEAIMEREEALRKVELEIDARRAREAAREERIASFKALGKFRLAKAHQFKGESAMRPSKPASGPMDIVEMIKLIDEGRIEFEPMSQPSQSDTQFMWVERQDGNRWVRIELNKFQLDLIGQTIDGTINMAEAQGIVRCLLLVPAAVAAVA